MVNVLIGLTIGIISGFGIGGGSLFIIYLTMYYDQLLAQGINLAYFVCCASPALFLHFKNNLVCKKAMFYCSCCGIITSLISSSLANNIDTIIVRRAFGLFLIYIGFKMIFEKKANT